MAAGVAAPGRWPVAPAARASARSLRALGLALALLAAAGVAPARAATDPCLLVSASEAGTALGSPVAPGEADGLGGCTYRAQRQPQDQVQVRLDEGPGRDRRAYFERQRQRSNVVAVPGLGDGAFAFVSPAGFVQVTVLAGDRLLDVTLTIRQHPDRVGAASRLAREAVDRLARGTAVARMPGLDALAGRWHARVEGAGSGASIRLWTVRPDGGYVLTVAVEEQAALVAERGQWAMGVPGSAIQGGYTLRGRDALVTTGALAARWTRVRDGRPPSRVDPGLLGVWTGIPLTGHRQPGPLDPGLVGLWEGESVVDGAPVELVWRIQPAGLAVLTTVHAEAGRVEAAGGRLTLRATAGPAVTGHYRVAGRDQIEVTIEGATTRWQRRGTGVAPR